MQLDADGTRHGRMRAGDGASGPHYNVHPMRIWLRKWWRVLKKVFAIAIIAAIARIFIRDYVNNPDLWKLPLRYDWLALAGLLYLGGLGFSAIFWHRLLRSLDQPVDGYTSFRAYYIGHLGKYLPGKAWALFLRANLASSAGVRVGVAVQTSFYEVLTTMAAGALLGGVIVALNLPSSGTAIDWHGFLRMFTETKPEIVSLDYRLMGLVAICLILATGIPIFPPIFNRLVRRMHLPFRDKDSLPLPIIGFPAMAQGLLLTTVGWLFMGVSLLACLQAMLPSSPDWSIGNWGKNSAYLSLAYVAGFVVIWLPNGIGVRELFLAVFLTSELESVLGQDSSLSPHYARHAAVLLRITWTLVELVFIGSLYFLHYMCGRRKPTTGVAAEAKVDRRG